MIVAVEFQSKRDRKGSLEARSFRGTSLELPRAVVVVVIVVVLVIAAVVAKGGISSPTLDADRRTRNSS